MKKILMKGLSVKIPFALFTILAAHFSDGFYQSVSEQVRVIFVLIIVFFGEVILWWLRKIW